MIVFEYMFLSSDNERKIIVSVKQLICYNFQESFDRSYFLM